MWMATLTGFESGAGQQGIRRGCTVFGVEAELGGCLLSVYSEGGEHVFREEHHGDGDGTGGGWGDGKAGRRNLHKGVRSVKIVETRAKPQPTLAINWPSDDMTPFTGRVRLGKV
jgi:hypothetical protein